MRRFYKIVIFRKFIVAIRFFYYVFFLRKFKILDKNHEIIFDYKSSANNKESKRPDYFYTTMQAYENSNLKFSNIKKNFFNIFAGKRAQLLINPINSCTFINKKTSRILSIGPRNEAEIFCLIANNFDKKNINSIDLFSYSPLIQVGDIHNIKFPDNSFDIILCGWVLAYSYNINKAISEIIRVSKNNSIISIGSSIGKEVDKRLTNSEILKYFSDNLYKIIFNVDEKDFLDKTNNMHSILCLRINK